MSCFKFISFGNVSRGRENKVRVTDDKMIVAIDLVMVVTGMNRNSAGRILRDLDESCFDPSKLIIRKFTGTGNSKTKLVGFSDAIELIMVLPGKTSKLCRKRMADVISRYLDGDLNMINEITANNKLGQIKSYLNFAQNMLSEMEVDNPMSFGYVYASSSPAFPGLIKIGKSINVDRRMAQLNTSCAPSPHVILVIAPSFNNTRDERLAHDYFSSYRREGEFFQVSEEEVREYFKSTITARFQAELEQNMSNMTGRVV